MGEKSSIGTIHCGSGAKATLAEISSGKRAEFLALSSEEGPRHQSRGVLDDLEKKGEPEKKVWKDVAILFCYGKTAKKALNIIKRFHPL